MSNDILPVSNFENFEDVSDPTKIVEDIKRKRGRKPGHKNKVSTEETVSEINSKYYSGEIWGEVINLPFKVMEIVTQYPDWQIDREQKEKMGEHLGNVIRGFFPALDVKNEKYLALIALISLFIGTFGMKAAQWKLVSNLSKKQNA